MHRWSAEALHGATVAIEARHWTTWALHRTFIIWRKGTRTTRSIKTWTKSTLSVHRYIKSRHKTVTHQHRAIKSRHRTSRAMHWAIITMNHATRPMRWATIISMHRTHITRSGARRV